MDEDAKNILVAIHAKAREALRMIENALAHIENELGFVPDPTAPEHSEAAQPD